MILDAMYAVEFREVGRRLRLSHREGFSGFSLRTGRRDCSSFSSLVFFGGVSNWLPLDSS